MSNLRKIEQLTGGKALLEKRPADNYFPAEHWFLQTANGGTFASMSRQEVLCVALDVISEEAAEQSLHQTALPRDVEAHDRAIEVELLCESC